MIKTSKISPSNKEKKILDPNVNSLGLIEFKGEWNWKEASHLLRRTLFGPTYTQIKESVSNGLNSTIELLFSEQEEPDLPINYFFRDDPLVPIGETWVGKKATPNVKGLISSRNASLTAWITNLMLEDKVSILEKMMLFWHNHLVISDIFPANIKYSYITLLRNFALGDFKELVKQITIDPSMLIYLNGRENSAKAPNENYGRELMELFTIGKGPLVGDGDYTNYTEHDIREFSRSLSGWIVRNGIAVFRSNRHDKDEKILSQRFNNKTISNLEENEYKEVVDILFQQEEVSKFISRQLYIWFVNYNISENVELDVIEPMAKILRDNDYVIEPVVKALLKSEHFYNECNKGVMIKSPIDYTMSIVKTGNFPTSFDDNIINKYKLSNTIDRRVFRKMDQFYFGLPSVAGWKAYYQEPVYYKIWLSSVTLPLRKALVESLIKPKTKIGDKRYGLELLDLVSKFDNPGDPDDLIKSFTDIFFVYDLTDEQYNFLKTQVLIPGLPDYEWTVEFSEYVNDPTNNTKSKPILNRLQELLSVMLNLPEFQMM